MTGKMAGKVAGKLVGKAFLKGGSKFFNKLAAKAASKAAAKVVAKLAAKAGVGWIPLVGGAVFAGINRWLVGGMLEAAERYYRGDYIIINDSEIANLAGVAGVAKVISGNKINRTYATTPYIYSGLARYASLTAPYQYSVSHFYEANLA